MEFCKSGYADRVLADLGIDSVYRHDVLSSRYGHEFFIFHVPGRWPRKGAHRLCDAMVAESAARGRIVEGQIRQSCSMPAECDVSYVCGVRLPFCSDSLYLEPEPPRIPRVRRLEMEQAAALLEGPCSNGVIERAAKRTAKMGIHGNGTVRSLDEIWLEIYRTWPALMIAELLRSDSPMCTWIAKNQMVGTEN